MKVSMNSRPEQKPLESITQTRIATLEKALVAADAERVKDRELARRATEQMVKRIAELEQERDKLQGALESSNNAAKRRGVQRNALRAALEKIIATEPEPYDLTPEEYASIGPGACEECKRYESHPIQNGICDDHRRLLYKRDNERERRQNTLDIKLKTIAAEALTGHPAKEGVSETAAGPGGRSREQSLQMLVEQQAARIAELTQERNRTTQALGETIEAGQGEISKLRARIAELERERKHTLRALATANDTSARLRVERERNELREHPLDKWESLEISLEMLTDARSERHELTAKLEHTNAAFGAQLRGVRSERDELRAALEKAEKVIENFLVNPAEPPSPEHEDEARVVGGVLHDIAEALAGHPAGTSDTERLVVDGCDDSTDYDEFDEEGPQPTPEAE